MTKLKPKFTGEADFQLFFQDTIIKANFCFYVPNHRVRMKLARSKLKSKTQDDDFRLADELYDLIDSDVISADVQIFKSPSDLKEPSSELKDNELKKAQKKFDEKVSELDCGHLELIDRITDKDAIGHYDFSTVLYPKLIEKFASGIKPGKKLQRS